MPPTLKPGDIVCLLSSADHPSRDLLQAWGLKVQPDEPRLSVLHNAFQDPAVRAVVVADDSGLHRIAHRLGFDAIRRDPKPVIGVGQTTYLHLALWRELGLPGIHGAPTESLRQLLMTADTIAIHRAPDDLTAQVGVEGQATGVLIGGNLNALTRSIGTGLPNLNGGILLLEDARVVGLGVVDRALTQFLRSGFARGLRGIALGQFTGFDGYADRGWTLVDVLRDRLGQFGVPVLGGLPIGPEALAVPVGTTATLDTAAGTLTVAAVTASRDVRLTSR